MPKKNIVLVFSLYVIIYAVFVVFSIDERPMGDSIYFLISAKIFNNELLQERFSWHPQLSTGLWHTPLYVIIVALLDAWLGITHVTIRFAGIFFFVITLWLIYAIAVRVFQESEKRYTVGFIAILLYAINPMAIQGSLLPDIDTTVMAPLLLLFIYIFAAQKEKGGYLLLGASFALALWAKLVTPFALILALFLYYLIKEDMAQAVKKTGIVFIIGILLFLVSWAIYCSVTNRPFLYPLQHLAQGLIKTPRFVLGVSLKATVVSIVRATVRIALYTSPFYFLIFIMALWNRFTALASKRGVHRIDFLIIVSVIIFVCYLLVGRLGHSFPKYHYPFLSLSVIAAAGFIAEKVRLEKRFFLLAAACTAAIVLYNVFVVGDFLYSTDYALRESVIVSGGLTSEVLKNAATQVALYILPFLLAWSFLVARKRENSFSSLILIWTVASSLSMNIIQARADYHTVYCYGGRGTEEVLSLLRKISERGKSVLTMEDIYYNVDEEGYLESPRSILRVKDCLDPASFIAAVRAKKPDCVVFSVSSNPVEQYKKVFHNPMVIDFLKKDFLRREIGSYTIWIRRRY